MTDSIAKLHQPVLCTEVLRYLSPLAGKTLVDGTLGLGGHAEAMLKADETVTVIGGSTEKGEEFVTVLVSFRLKSNVDILISRTA